MKKMEILTPKHLLNVNGGVGVDAGGQAVIAEKENYWKDGATIAAYVITGVGILSLIYAQWAYSGDKKAYEAARLASAPSLLSSSSTSSTSSTSVGAMPEPIGLEKPSFWGQCSTWVGVVGVTLGIGIGLLNYFSDKDKWVL